MGNLPDLYSRTNFTYLKRIFASEMVAEVFSSILTSELNYIYHTFPAEEIDEITVEMVNKIIMDCAHVMINELFSYSAKSESIWKIVVREINKKYRIIVSKEDVIPGYLLGAIMHRNGIDCFYKSPEFNRER